MRKIDTKRKAEIIVVTGSSGSGKSAWVKQQIKDAKRLIVWDIDDEYSGITGVKRFDSISLMAKALLKAQTGKFCFVGAVSQFEAFCKAAFAWGDCVCVVEELADVTSPAKAPDGWGQLVRRGRKYGISIYAVTQRPSESDKTIIGNASLIHCGRMQREADQKYMAGEMNLRLEVVKDLKPLEYLEKCATGESYRGKVTFSGRKTPKIPLTQT